MRNRFPGICYRCGELVEAGAGHFERHNSEWRTQHAVCAIEYRAGAKLTTPNERTQARKARRDKLRAAMGGDHEP